MSNFLISDEIIQSVIEITKQAGAVIMDVYKTNLLKIGVHQEL